MSGSSLGAGLPRCDCDRRPLPGGEQEPRDRERQRTVQTRGRHEERETINRTIRVGGNGEIIVSNLSGDITVTRGTGNDLQIEAVKVARGRDAADAREMLGLVRAESAAHVA